MKGAFNDNVGVPLGQQEYLNGIMSPTMLHGNYLTQQNHAARKSHGYVQMGIDGRGGRGQIDLKSQGKGYRGGNSSNLSMYQPKTSAGSSGTNNP